MNTVVTLNKCISFTTELFFSFSFFLRIFFSCEIQYFKGIKKCPIYCCSAPCYSIQELVSVLICTDEDRVCTERQIACRGNATFILDTSTLHERDDFKADDNGSFRNQGKKTDVVQLDDSGNVTKLSSQPTILKECQYKLIRTYWVHTSNPDFKRRVAELEDREN